MEKVNGRRNRMYEYIVTRINSGAAPTVREICADLHIASTSTVHSDLHYLIDSGMIEMDAGLNRTIRLPSDSNVLVPLLGTVTAGEPILAMQNIERYISLSISGGKDKELFALHVKGDSMVNAAIIDGDIVVVEKISVAVNGQIVVAMIDDSATVKRYFIENGQIRLQPENDNYQPIILDSVILLGKVLSVVRFYD